MRHLIMVSCLLLLLLSASAAQANVVNGVESDRIVPPPPPPSAPLTQERCDVFINFDEDAEPCGFGFTVALRAKYAGLGVTFAGPAALDGGAILNECGHFGVSGYSSPNFLAFNCGAAFSGGGIPQGPEVLTFSAAISDMAILVGSSHGGTLTIDAYDSNGNAVDSDSIVLGPTLQLLGVQGTDIVTVVIGTPNPCIWVADDLCVTSGTPTPEGACCDHATGNCVVTTQANCPFDWLGAGVLCDVETCPPPTGACCDHATGACTITTQAACAFEWLGAGVPCDVETCPPPTGACCDRATGACTITTQAACAFEWLGAGVPCDVETCPPPTGACCDHATGACTITTQAACAFQWLGAGVPCNVETCVPPVPTERTSWGQIKNTYR